MNSSALIEEFCLSDFGGLLRKYGPVKGKTKDGKAASLRLTFENEGFALYSYTTVIARRFLDATNREVVWVNTEKYSVTTSKSQGRLYRFPPASLILRTVGDPETLPNLLVFNDKLLENAELQALDKKYAEIDAELENHDGDERKRLFKELQKVAKARTAHLVFS